MFFTYVLLSKKDYKFYMGFRKDLEKRVDEYRRGLIVSTATRRPLKLVYYEACLNEKDAINREKYLKTGFGRRFLKNSIKTYIDDEL